MQVSLSTVAGLERRMEVAVPAERVSAEIETRLKNVARTARLKGFRPGKAPLPVVRQQFGAQVQSEVVGDLLRESYSDAVTQQSLRPATDPRIELVSAEPGAELRYVASFEVLPEISIGALADLSIERVTATIGESDIEAMLDSMRRQRPDFNAVDRGATDTDRVTVDFEGRIDGVTFQGGTGTDVPFVVGQGRMLKEFEDGVRGAKAGESRSVVVNFPADYGSADVAGKTAVFAVTVKSVEEQKLPEIDEDFCLSFGVTEGGVEALREAVVSSMENELAKAIRGQLRTQVLDALYAANPIDVPKSMIAEQVQAMQVDFARRMGLRDLSQLPQTDAMEEPARRRVATGLIVSELLRAENLKLDREYVNRRLTEATGEGPGSDELRRQYLQSVEAMRQIESLALEDQLVDFVVGRAKVTDKPSTFAELTGFGRNPIA